METTRKEASPVEFTLICPTDGRIELGLEDVSAVVFHGSDSVEVVFECPHCQAKLRAEVRVPNLLGAAIELTQFAEDMAEEPSLDVQRRTRLGEHDAHQLAEARIREARERDGEAYCEYFRRQLAGIECVEDVLREFE